MPKLNYSKVVLSNTDFLTAQAFVFPKVISEEESSESIFVLISSSGEDVFTKVRQLGPRVEETFFEEMELAPKEKIQKIKDLLLQELKKVEKSSLILGVLKGEILYLESSGEHQAYLFRKGTLHNLTSQGANQLISGYIKDEDSVLFLGSSIDPASSDEPLNLDQKIIERLIQSNPDDLEEDISEKMQELHNSDPIAAILIKKGEFSKSIIPQIDEKPKISERFVQIRSLLINSLSVFGKLPKIGLKLKIIGVIALIVLFVGGMGVYKFYQTQKRQAAQTQALLEEARSKFSEAQGLKDSDRQKALDDLDVAKYNVFQVLDKEPKNPQAMTLKSEIESGSSDILKVYQITDWPVFLSLDLIRQNFRTSRISYSLGKVLLLDDSQKTLVSLDLETKKNQILAGNTQLGDAKYASLNGANAFVYSSDKGILDVDLDTNKVSVVAKFDAEWGVISDIYGFAGNVYAVDGLKTQIWKYIPTKTGYSDKFTYLADNKGLDFAGAKRLFIDYSVWVLKPGPEIYRFTAGNQDAFSVGGMDKNLGDIQSMFIPEEGDNAYFLDKDNSRLVVLNKNGLYQAQYTGDKFKTASDFIVDEEGKKIYLLEENKLFVIPLH